MASSGDQRAPFHLVRNPRLSWSQKVQSAWTVGSSRLSMPSLESHCSGASNSRPPPFCPEGTATATASPTLPPGTVCAGGTPQICRTQPERLVGTSTPEAPPFGAGLLDLAGGGPGIEP